MFADSNEMWLFNHPFLFLWYPLTATKAWFIYAYKQYQFLEKTLTF